MKKPFLNTLLFGIIAGLIIVLIAFYFILMLNKSIIGYTERTVFDFLSYLMDYDAGRSEIIPKLLSLSAIADLLLFFVFIWTDKLKSARGVIASAFLVGIAVMILKFL
jgi:hypothetical protein